LSVGNDLSQEGVAINGGKLPCITNNCSSFTSALENSPGFTSLPDGFKTDALNIGRMTDGLNGASSITSGTLNSAASVGTSALRIANELKKQKTDFQGRLLASGSNYKIDDEENNLKGQINSAYNDMLKKNKTSNQALLAAYGMGPSSSELVKTTEETNKKINKKIVGNFEKIIVPSFKVDSVSGSKGNSVIDLSTDNEAAKIKAERDALVKNDNIENYVLETDITRDKTENLFDVISTRYKKSGYPRLLKRISDKE
jgi:ribosomal protein L17